MDNFSNKVIVITGGATGIGFGYAKAFGKEGAKVVISGRRENRLQEAITALNNNGIEAKAILADASSLEDTEKLADFAWDSFGKVDVLINNAGMMVHHAPVLDMPLEDIHAIFNVNLFGVVIGSQVFGKRFVDQGIPAAIYNIGSENSLFHGTPFNGAYVATKHGVLAFTHSLREELPDFIDVSLICPGFVVSELGPPENMQYGMPTDQFVSITMPQLKANEFYVVSHAYNVVMLHQKQKALAAAYATYAPRYEGDVRYDVRTNLSPVLQQQVGQSLREF